MFKFIKSFFVGSCTKCTWLVACLECSDKYSKYDKELDEREKQKP